ncbi:hypothetical protein Tsubulata_027247 [Turnera subulata]|uniref:CRM domain-containing protein n=1 Tax=Turnera subulata TaxID=218843 RepID=A0A9Q0F0H8_9ROSI|nr:hypothetical protein Tsubulata_027247 [Turnera subulata]
MARALTFGLRRASSLLKQSSSSTRSSLRPIVQAQASVFSSARHIIPLNLQNPSWVFRNLSHGSVNLVISEGKVKFETHEVDPPKKHKWLTKKRFLLQKRKEKEKRKAANRKDPRRLTVKGKKQKFATVEERIKSKLERAKIKEASLVERLKRYEVPKAQGPVVKPHNLTGEERFFIKKMAQKKSNYVPVGRRGIFGGVILNMHMHWKKHETVKVILNSCKPGQIHEYAQEIARLSGGIPIQTIGDDTIVFYRGKDYVQPKVMSPIDTLSKKKAYEKSKYEQSLETVRHFIAVAEKELELYHRHMSLYGDPNNGCSSSILSSPTDDSKESRNSEKRNDDLSSDVSDTEADSTYQELDDFEDEDPLIIESDSDDDNLSDMNHEERAGYSFMTGESLSTTGGSSSTLENTSIKQ